VILKETIRIINMTVTVPPIEGAFHLLFPPLPERNVCYVSIVSIETMEVAHNH
jgi:hypothetical protein